MKKSRIKKRKNRKDIIKRNSEKSMKLFTERILTPIKQCEPGILCRDLCGPREKLRLAIRDSIHETFLKIISDIEEENRAQNELQ